MQIQKKEKQITLLATIKQIHTIENGALQITFFQRKMKSILGRWEGDFCCLFILFTFLV